MEKQIQSSLCKGLRACGLPKRQTLDILNEVILWHRNNGVEWTVTRLKDIRYWYETYLGGDPKPAAWCGRTKTNMPKGIWGWLFKQPTGKVLGILSCTTVFKNSKPSAAQMKKFHHGLQGNGFSVDSSKLRLGRLYVPYEFEDLRRAVTNKHCALGQFYYVENGGCRVIGKSRRLDKLTVPNSGDITGTSVPVQLGNMSVHPIDLEDKMEALRLSWKDLPQTTLEFLLQVEHLDFIPISEAGNQYQLELDRKRNRVVGRIGCIQQGELKARWIANPNRVVQCFLKPLQNLYMETLRDLPTDCTHNQDEGVTWVQKMLQDGIELSGSDLSSASDLLSREACAIAVGSFYGFDEIRDYDLHVKHFLEVSALEWRLPDNSGDTITWQQGQPLGTGPSFGLMGLTNNICGLVACHRSGIPLDSYRVIGDDIIMDSKALDNYTQLITECFGGEINLSKTLTSCNVAEFAGRIITPNRVYLKKVNYCDPSDQNFMAIMSQLGPQGISLLRHRQRRVFNEFKYIPGVAVEGPYLKDSFGEPFDTRYEFYLNSPLSKDEPEPDKVWHTAESELLQYQVFATNYFDTAEEAIEKLTNELPFPMSSSYLEDLIPDQATKSGDPRLVDGKSTLQVFEKHLNSDSWIGYQTIKEEVTAQQLKLDKLLQAAENLVSDLIIDPDLNEETGCEKTEP